MIVNLIKREYPNWNHTQVNIFLPGKTHKYFEINNPHVSLILYNENDEVIYPSNNVSNNKAYIAKTNDCRYAAIQPPTIKNIKLKKLLRSFSHKEISDYIMQEIIV